MEKKLDERKKFQVGDVVFVSNPDKEYEKTDGTREHNAFFGKVLRVDEYPDGDAVAVSYKEGNRNVVWSYLDSELSLASELNRLTTEEVVNMFGSDVLEEFTKAMK